MDGLDLGVPYVARHCKTQLARGRNEDGRYSSNTFASGKSRMRRQHGGAKRSDMLVVGGLLKPFECSLFEPLRNEVKAVAVSEKHANQFCAPVEEND